jgi:predicted secreted Zn-dependent protease
MKIEAGIIKPKQWADTDTARIFSLALALAEKHIEDEDNNVRLFAVELDFLIKKLYPWAEKAEPDDDD